MATYIIEFVADCSDSDYTLTIKEPGQSVTFGSCVIPSIFQITPLKDIDPRVIGFWAQLVKTQFPLTGVVVFGKDGLIYEGSTINMDPHVALDTVWQEFQDVQNTWSPTSEDPYKVAQLLQFIENDQISESIDSMFVHTTRVCENQLPAVAWIQYGKISGTKIEWHKPYETTLMWSSKANLENDPGIVICDGEWEYAGWVPTQGIYLRYNNALPGQEHCMRIVYKAGCDVLKTVDFGANFIPVPDVEGEGDEGEEVGEEGEEVGEEVAEEEVAEEEGEEGEEVVEEGDGEDDGEDEGGEEGEEVEEEGEGEEVEEEGEGEEEV
ncbi:hypothetical protein LCGC14_3105270, partial [marine sediment metagenome]